MGDNAICPNCEREGSLFLREHRIVEHHGLDKTMKPKPWYTPTYKIISARYVCGCSYAGPEQIEGGMEAEAKAFSDGSPQVPSVEDTKPFLPPGITVTWDTRFLKTDKKLGRTEHVCPKCKSTDIVEHIQVRPNNVEGEKVVKGSYRFVCHTCADMFTEVTKRKKKPTYRCGHCGSDKVQVSAFMWANTKELVNEIEGPLQGGWCDNCTDVEQPFPLCVDYGDGVCDDCERKIPLPPVRRLEIM